MIEHRGVPSRRPAPHDFFVTRSIKLSSYAPTPTGHAFHDRQPQNPQGKIEIADGEAAAHAHHVGILPAGARALRSGDGLPTSVGVEGTAGRGSSTLPDLGAVLIQIGNVALLEGIFHRYGRLSQAFQPSRQGGQSGRGRHELLEIRLPTPGGRPRRLLRRRALMDILIFLFHKDTPKMMCSGVVWAENVSSMQGESGNFQDRSMISVHKNVYF